MALGLAPSAAGTVALRARAWRAIRALGPGRVGLDLGAHARAAARVLTAAEAAAVCRAVDAGDDEAATAALAAALIGRRGVPAPLGVLAARAAAVPRLARTGLEGISTPTNAVRLSDERRVLLAVHSASPLVPNGYAARTEEVARAAEAAGWRPSAVTRLGYPRDLNRYAGLDDHVPEVSDVPCAALPDPADGLRGRALDDYVQAYAQALAGAAREAGAGIIHAASSHHNGLAAALAARTLGIASVYELRGLWHVTALSEGKHAPLGEADVRYRLADRLERQAARACNHVVALSEPLARWAREAGVPAERVTVVPNVVSTVAPSEAPSRAALSIPDDALVVGYAGALKAYEGLDLVLDAAATARRGGADVRVLIVGGGPEAAALRRRADGDETVLLLSPRPRAEAAALMALADVAPLCRRDLPVTRMVPPIKLAEAMARGQAVVVSDVEALSSLVRHEETGLVVPPGDAGALAAAFARLAREPGLRRALGQAAAREAAERFGTDAASAALDRAYAAALARAAS